MYSTENNYSTKSSPRYRKNKNKRIGDCLERNKLFEPVGMLERGVGWGGGGGGGR